jgi:tetratricopeptide (TPR) repeat protein
MKAALNIAKPLCASVFLLLGLLLGGCRQMFQSFYLSGYDRDIGSSAREIETARDNAHLAAAYTKRGSAYSEKARYSRASKLISADEYERLFGLAVKDHDQAIALDPTSAEAYYWRGQTYYDRAALEVVVDGVLVVKDSAARKAWFDPAVADFKRAIEKDGRNDQAWDMLGLSHEMAGELDEAISAYSQEMALVPFGRVRLADAYCARGDADQKEKKSDAAIADYEKSIDIGATADGCSCDPYNPLFVLYDKNRRYDQGWEVVNKARRSKKWIAPELLDILKKDSGRSN